MISIMDFIIGGFTISFSSAAIVGTLVYCVLAKKHKEDIEWLFNKIYDDKIRVNKFYERYQNHLEDFHF